MCKKIERPTDPYSPLWAMYWGQNPGLHRGVGADGVNDDDAGGGEDNGEEGGDVEGEGSETPANDNGDSNDNTENSNDKAEDKKPKKKGPSDTEAKLLKEVMQKKEKLKAAEAELAKMKQEIKKFEGIDLEQVQTLIKQQKEAETKRLEAKGEWEKLKKQMQEQQQSELKQKEEQIAELMEKLQSRESVINELTVGHAFDSSKFIGEKMTLTPRKARIVYGSHFDVEDGKVVAYDKPRGAEGRTPLVNSSGDPLGFEEAIQKIVDADPDRDHIIRSKVKPGADSKTLSGKRPESKPELRGQSKIAAALANANKGSK